MFNGQSDGVECIDARPFASPPAVVHPRRYITHINHTHRHLTHQTITSDTGTRADDADADSSCTCRCMHTRICPCRFNSHQQRSVREDEGAVKQGKQMTTLPTPTPTVAHRTVAVAWAVFGCWVCPPATPIRPRPVRPSLRAVGVWFACRLRAGPQRRPPAAGGGAGGRHSAAPAAGAGGAMGRATVGTERGDAQPAARPRRLSAPAARPGAAATADAAVRSTAARRPAAAPPAASRQSTTNTQCTRICSRKYSRSRGRLAFHAEQRAHTLLLPLRCAHCVQTPSRPLAQRNRSWSQVLHNLSSTLLTAAQQRTAGAPVTTCDKHAPSHAQTHGSGTAGANAIGGDWEIKRQQWLRHFHTDHRSPTRVSGTLNHNLHRAHVSGRERTAAAVAERDDQSLGRSLSFCGRLSVCLSVDGAFPTFAPLSAHHSPGLHFQPALFLSSNRATRRILGPVRSGAYNGAGGAGPQRFRSGAA